MLSFIDAKAITADVRDQKESEAIFYLFLDIDGVLLKNFYLSCEYGSLSEEKATEIAIQNFSKQAVKNLEDLITYIERQKKVKVKIVLSSDWRTKGVEKIKQLFSRANLAFADKIIASTIQKRLLIDGLRGEEIALWLYENAAPQPKFLIIDDNDEGISTLFPQNFVSIDRSLLLTEQDLTKAKLLADQQLKSAHFSSQQIDAAVQQRYKYLLKFLTEKELHKDKVADLILNYDQAANRALQNKAAELAAMQANATEQIDIDGNNLLMQAIKEENDEKAISLISLCNVNARNKNGESPLYLAARINNTNLMNKLIDAKADVNETDKNSNSLLMNCRNQTEAAIVLIKRGADLNFKNKSGRTLLMEAAFMRKPNIVEAILAQKPNNVDDTDNKGQTALFIATIEADREFDPKDFKEYFTIIELLANANADPYKNWENYSFRDELKSFFAVYRKKWDERRRQPAISTAVVVPANGTDAVRVAPALKL